MIHQANTKINLGLRILNKREDGYHNIETIFYPLPFGDELKIKISSSHTNSNSLKITSDNIYVPRDKTNICFKAIANFLKEFGIRSFFHFDISIKKVIPIGSGLGSGSSEAAEVIKHLVKFFNINIKQDGKKIMNVATATGSDVPFFLISKPCYATGVGDKLRILRNFKIDYKILVVVPKIHVSTAAAYKDLNIGEGYNEKPVFDKIEKFDIKDKELYVNDFEKVILPKYPEIKNIKDEMYGQGAELSLLSGSGAGVFGLYKNESDATSALKYFSDKGYFARKSV